MPRKYIYIDPRTGEEKGSIEGVERFMFNLPAQAIANAIESLRGRIPEWVLRRLEQKRDKWVIKGTDIPVNEGDYIIPTQYGDLPMDPKTFQENFRGSI